MIKTRPNKLQEKIFEQLFEAAEIATRCATKNPSHVHLHARDFWNAKNAPPQYKIKK